MKKGKNSMNNRDSLGEFALQMQKIIKALHNHSRKTLMELGFSFPQLCTFSAGERRRI